VLRLSGGGALVFREFLVLIALDRLRSEPDWMSLLCALLRVDTFPWHSRPEHLAALRDFVYPAANELSQITDDLEPTWLRGSDVEVVCRV
jgi:hypothetical protein